MKEFLRTAYIRRVWILLLTIVLAGCNFPSGTPQALPAAQFTQAAQTIAAQVATVVSPVTRTAEPTLAGLPTAKPTLPFDTPTVAAPTFTPAPTPTEALTLLFSDDFADETGWFTEQGDNYGFEFSDGGYRMYANIPNANIWSIRDTSYTDIILEVEAAQLSGGTDGYYGLLCRQVDGDNFYGLVINSNGFYGIGKMEAGEWDFLQNGQDNGQVIKLGLNVFNKIRADCSGNNLRLYVNGQKLTEVQDDDYLEGDTGLMIGTLNQPELEALFDNYATYQMIK